MSALREMLANGALRMLPVGFIDDDPSRKGKTVSGVPIVGTVHDLEMAIRSRRAKAVVVSTRKVPEERVAFASAACQRTGAHLVRMDIRFDEVQQPTTASTVLALRDQDIWRPLATPPPEAIEPSPLPSFVASAANEASSS